MIELTEGCTSAPPHLHPQVSMDRYRAPVVIGLIGVLFVWLLICWNIWTLWEALPRVAGPGTAPTLPEDTAYLPEEVVEEEPEDGLLRAPLAGEVRFDGEGHAYHPLWSLDGRHLAFEVNRYAGDIELFFVEMKGTEAEYARAVALPGGGSGFGSSGQVMVNPSWHPQGIAVFEGSNQGGEYRMYFAQPGGASAAEMLPSSLAPGNLTFPAISPDGNKLAYVSAETGNGDIRSWDRSSNMVTQLTSTDESEMFPMYHQSGERMLFTRKKNNTEDIFELDVADQSEKVIAGGEGDQTRPIYAANDAVVFFISERGTEHWDVAVVDEQGDRILAKDVRLPLRARPALTPDGEWVAFGYDDPRKNRQIGLVHIESGQKVLLWMDWVAVGEPALTLQNDRLLLAYTALPSTDSDWRFLSVVDITGFEEAAPSAHTEPPTLDEPPWPREVVVAPECPGYQHGGDLIGPDCITDHIACDEAIVGHTLGGTQRFDNRWYARNLCASATPEHDGGDERVYRFSFPEHGDWRAWITLDSPCADLDLFAMVSPGEQCPGPLAEVDDCLSERMSGTSRERLEISSDLDMRDWLLVVEGHGREEGAFGLSVQCRRGL